MTTDLWEDFKDGESYSRDLLDFVLKRTGMQPLGADTLFVDLGDGRVLIVDEPHDSYETYPCDCWEYE